MKGKKYNRELQASELVTKTSRKATQNVYTSTLGPKDRRLLVTDSEVSYEGHGAPL